MTNRHSQVPLNAIRVFAAIAREMSVTRAAAGLGVTQSAASHHLSVLEEYLGARLLNRRGRYIELTDFGRQFYEAVVDSLDDLHFTAQKMQRRSEVKTKLVVFSSLPTLLFSTVIPRLGEFTSGYAGASVNIVTTFAPPTSDDRFDVLVTRDLKIHEAAQEWKLLDEELVCVGAPSIVADAPLQDLVSRLPVMTTTLRPDVLPKWTSTLGIALSEVIPGPNYDHHFLAIPAALTGQALFVTPEILVGDLIKGGALSVVPQSRVNTGMTYRAYSVDRSGSSELARNFCRWLVRLCRANGGKAAASAPSNRKN